MLNTRLLGSDVKVPRLCHAGLSQMDVILSGFGRWRWDFRRRSSIPGRDRKCASQLSKFCEEYRRRGTTLGPARVCRSTQRGVLHGRERLVCRARQICGSSSNGYARKHFGQQIVRSMTGSIERYFTAVRTSFGILYPASDAVDIAIMIPKTASTALLASRLRPHIICSQDTSVQATKVRRRRRVAGPEMEKNQHLALKTVTKLTCIFPFYIFIVKPGFKTPGALILWHWWFHRVCFGSLNLNANQYPVRC